MIQEAVPGTTVEFVPDAIEKRDHNLNFDKIHKILGFKAKHALTEGINEIKLAIEKGVIDVNDVRTVRANYYKYLLEVSQIPNAVNEEFLPIVS